jgi:hypothetical protein
MFARFMMSLAAMLSGSAMSFCGSLMLLRSGSMCFNHIVVFAHSILLFAMPGHPGSSVGVRCKLVAFQATYASFS